jgi:branched-chain amino acid transport system ATP-binding protein
MVDTKGSVLLDGVECVGKATEWIVRKGVAHVPQGRGTFPELTVQENLEAGAYVRTDREVVREDIERWLGVFPRLAERRAVRGSLSGGSSRCSRSPVRSCSGRSCCSSTSRRSGSRRC